MSNEQRLIMTLWQLFHYGHFGRKSCPRDPKHEIWLLWGWGRCLKVTLQKGLPEYFPLMTILTWAHDGSSVSRPGSKDPYQRERKFLVVVRPFISELPFSPLVKKTSPSPGENYIRNKPNWSETQLKGMWEENNSAHKSQRYS